MLLFLRLLPALLWIQAICAIPPSPNARPDYVLVATAKNLAINCQRRYSVVINGTSPGPTLYLKENFTTWIRVYNRIPDQNLTVVCCC